MRCLLLGTLLAFTVQVHAIITAAGETSCDSGQCNQSCINEGWSEGYCKDGLCWCWKYGQSGGRIEKTLQESKSTRSVIPRDGYCDVFCALMCNVGYCAGDICTCLIDDRQSSWMLLHEIPYNFKDTAGKDVTSCTYEKTCLDACKVQGAANGFCMKHLCWCSITNGTSAAGRNVRPLIELQSNIRDAVTTNDTCDPSDCRTQCNYKQKTGGSTCMYGYCWCKEPRIRTQEKQGQRSQSADVQSRENEIVKLPD